MDVYTTEEEQVEAIKRWWKENWMSVAAGIALGVTVLFGGKYWLDSRNHTLELASYEYEAMMDAVRSDNAKEAANRGQILLGQYIDTPYASLAALALAKIKVDEGDLLTAKTHLRWAMEKSDQQEVKTVAALRMGYVLLAEGKADEAMSQISAVKVGQHKAAYEELRGDIYSAKGDQASARSAYAAALAVMEPGDRGRSFLQLKLDNLGGAQSDNG